MQIQVETTNVCNADCVFCEYGKMSRPKGTMSMEMFRRIVDETATLPLVDHFTITGLGEPLLDRFLLDRIRYIRKVLPEIQLDIYTNGSFLRPAMTDSLIAAGLTTLYVSLNAVSVEKRWEVMKLHDFEEVMGYVRYAIAASHRSGHTQVIVKGIISKDLMENGDQEKFIDTFGGPSYMGGNAFLHLEGNWAGAVWPMRAVMKQPCSRALNQIMILQDGRVSLCCFDGDGREILGDLNFQTIREVFNGPKATGIRLAHSEGRRNEIALCAGCTGI